MSLKKSVFQRNKYSVLKGAISKELAGFAFDYFLKKRKVARFLFDQKYISPFTEYFGIWNDEQVPNTYSHYSDIAMETLLLAVQPKMEKLTGLKLNPTYSYARIYKMGDVLHRHKDRFSCEISTTMNLGGDEWPIYLEHKKNVGIPDDGFPAETDNKGTKVILKPGDMLVYKGEILEHWREAFIGDNCAQVFLHYNNQFSPGADDNIFDQRPHLGLPGWFKGKKINS